jgi:hypothetical protein
MNDHSLHQDEPDDSKVIDLAGYRLSRSGSGDEKPPASPAGAQRPPLNEKALLSALAQPFNEQSLLKRLQRRRSTKRRRRARSQAPLARAAELSAQVWERLAEVAGSEFERGRCLARARRSRDEARRTRREAA